MIIYGNFIPNLFSLFFKVDGVTLFPFIFVRRGVSETLIRHEQVHLIQQIKYLIVFFYIRYILEYIINLFRFRNTQQAYLNISFEKEAYSKEKEV
jgi:hypothetical protein